MNSTPVIVIPGLGKSQLILADKNGNKIKNAWPFELDEKKLISEFKGSLMSMLLFKKDAGFSDKVAKVVDDITDPLSLNPDGSKKHNIIVPEYKKSVAEFTDNEKKYFYGIAHIEEFGEKIGEDKLFIFTYDMFGDAYDIADSLDGFVAFVKEKTGCDKVSLLNTDTGGVVVKAYLQKYAEKNEIAKVVNSASAINGASIIADVFENKLNIGDPAALLQSIGGKAASLASSLKMLPAEIINNAITKAFNAAANNLLYNCTMMWGAIPDDRFDAVFESRIGSSGNPILASKVKSLHEFSVNLAKNVENIPFYNICGCGSELIPVASDANVSSDGVIDTVYASFGGKSANSSGEIDASACAFPEKTWFFRKQQHFTLSDNDIAMGLISKILADEITDVSSDVNYPQFNGSRNIKSLRDKLIPSAQEKIAAASEPIKNQLGECIAVYNSILKNTVIENDNDVKELENRLNDILDSVKE